MPDRRTPSEAPSPHPESPAAFEALIEALAPRALAIAHEILGAGDGAEQVVEDAFLTMWRTRHDAAGVAP